jgi:periplasmic divalent cation tolerance protein
MTNHDPLILVHTTCADQKEAEALARDLVETRLAACASVGQPLVSVYPWQGRIERDVETPLTLKTTRRAFEALRSRLVERHSYDVPEVLAVDVIDGNDEYIQWVRDWVAERGSSQ